MTVADALRQGTADLAAAGVAAPRLEAELLLGRATGRERQALLINSNEPVSVSGRSRFMALVKQRNRRVPLQQILGETEFYGLRILVNGQVMAPRPETEILVDEVLKRWRPEFRTILDIGTGSGCIAISLAKHLPESTVEAIDASEPALEMARQNIRLHGLEDRASAIHGDIFPDDTTTYDVIVSNPPYIPTCDIETLMPEVSQHEPRIALDGGPDGLDYYRKISVGLGRRLNRSGMVALEVGDGQADKVGKLISNAVPGLTIEVVKDLAGLERVVVANQD